MGTRPEAVIGAQHLGLDEGLDDPDIDRRTREMLSRCLNAHNVIAFVGSGVSQAYGYPSWRGFVIDLVQTAADLLDKSECTSIPGGERELILQVARSPEQTFRELPGSNSYLTVLDLCDETMLRLGEEQYKKFRLKAEELASREQRHENTKTDPLKVLLEHLEIRRFLTTNYDNEIESAFERQGCRIVYGDEPIVGVQGRAGPRSPLAGLDKDNLGLALPRIARSLTLETGNAEDLVRLAIAAPGFERGVFHVHGKARHKSAVRDDGLPDMVIAERDYQRVYLQEVEPQQRAYRDALRIALTGNAVLFVGVGMSEDDLLRPLRHFASNRTRQGAERPLFALMPKPATSAQSVEMRRSLYVRFGVKIIYYDGGGVDASPQQQSEALTSALKELGQDWQRWWPDWRRKPPARRPGFSTSPDKAWMIRHQILDKVDTARMAKTDGVRELVDVLNRSESHLMLLLGDAGTAKGSIGQALVESKIETKKHYERRFFASAHFTNDLLSIVESAASYFDPVSAELHDHRDPIERLTKALGKEGQLFVLGGLERLLSGNPPPVALGKLQTARRSSCLPSTLEVDRLLRSLVDAAGKGQIKSDIVLTSSVYPILRNATTDADSQAVRVITLDLKPLSPGHPNEVLSNLDLREDTEHDLAYVLRGHCYGLMLIANALAAIKPGAARQEEAEWYLARLGALDTNARPVRTVGLVLDARRRRWDALASAESKGLEGRSQLEQSLLQRVALCSTPIMRESLARTYANGASIDEVRDVVEGLLSAKLLLGVGPESIEAGGPQPSRITAHTLVRAYVLRELGDLPSTPGEALRFELTGWSSDVPETLAGQGASHYLTAECVEALLTSLERQSGADGGPKAAPATQAHDALQHRDALRAAFGLIRSRWTATAIPRLHALPAESSLGLPLPHYDAYQRRLVRLLRILRMSEHCTTRVEYLPQGRQDTEHLDAALYVDELCWLYNELGVAAFCQGFLADAEALLRATQLLNSFAEREVRGHRWCELELSLGVVQMEQGHLTSALQHLQTALAESEAAGAVDMAARARGHLGLVLHLLGRYEAALECYESAIAATAETSELRGRCIFLRHRGDLYRRLGKLKAAAEDIAQSLAIAHSGRFPDLLHYSRMAEANLLRARGTSVSIERLRPSVEFARLVGMPKLECALLGVQGLIALENREFELAERLSVASLSIATLLGMRLQMSNSLILAGRVAHGRGNPRSAESMLRSALEMAQRQRNQVAIESAEQHLFELGRPDAAAL